MKVGHKVGGPAATPKGRNTGGTARGGRPRAAATARGGTARGGTARGGTVRGGRPREPRGLRPGPQTAPAPRPVERIARPKDTAQAKARAKARKAKAPTVKRPSLRERLILKLEGVDLRPRTLLARIPFVMLIIGALALGLGITLWLSTASAQRSYQLGSARTVNDALMQQKEALERDVLEAQSAPALADAARNLGMIPSRDTAHLVQDPAGNWLVIGMPKPAEGAPPPPLNTKLPDPTPPVLPRPAPVVPGPGAFAEVPTLIAAVPVPGSVHASAGLALPGPGDTLSTGPSAPGALPAPTVPGVALAPPGSAVPPGSLAPPGSLVPPGSAVPPAAVAAPVVAPPVMSEPFGSPGVAIGIGPAVPAR